jgi:hypothetical protein
VTSAGWPMAAAHALNSILIAGSGKGSFAAGFVARNFFNAERVTDRAAEDFELFALRERLGAREDVVLAGVGGVAGSGTQGANGDGGDVALVNRRGRRREMGPPYRPARTNCGGPPLAGIRRKHSGAEHSPLQTG